VYDVLVPDYIMRGKDGYDALAEKKPVSDFGIDADLVRKYLKEHGSLPQLSGAPVISSSGG
jgi:2',3'-cyclic-nucleotide 2'-phosphodiesterase (5'-nucleotidase family)